MKDADIIGKLFTSHDEFQFLESPSTAKLTAVQLEYYNFLKSVVDMFSRIIAEEANDCRGE